uniref:Coiled-coil domain containing 114 n=1 Tax=Astyanax mexicanus TaxID=7994 RepID=A0A8B9H108_ASTMX
MPRGRSASAHSDSSDIDIDGAAETEMGKLQRQFRTMEGDRQAYSFQSQERIRKQRLEMEKLREEQEELQRSLRVSQSQTRKQSDSRDVQQLRTLLSQRDQLDEQLERERTEQAELEQEVITCQHTHRHTAKNYNIIERLLYFSNSVQNVTLIYYIDIQALERKHKELIKEEVSTNNSKKSLPRQIQKTSRTLEYKLDRDLKPIGIVWSCFLRSTVEDKNFALFNYVNEQNTQVEALRDQINQTKEEMERFHMEGLQQELEHQAALKEIEEQRREAEAHAVDNETQANEISEILDQIKTGVSTVLKTINFDQSMVEYLPGSSSGIRNNNIMTYLSLVEQKTNEMLTIQAFVNSKDLDKDYDPKEVAQLLLGQSQTLHKEADGIQPSFDGEEYNTDESLITEQDDQPLTVEELRRRIMNGV